MSNESKLATATDYLDEMLGSLREDLAGDGGELSADEIAEMAAALKNDAAPEWIEALMWVLAIAQVRLVRADS